MSMIRTALTATAAVVSMLFVSLLASPSAEARREHGWYGGPRHHVARPYYVRPPYRHYRPIYTYRPTYVAPLYYGYGNSCAWLRREAIESGSPYWWRRYRMCLGS